MGLLGQILVSSSVSALLLAVLIYLLRSVISERLSAAVRHEYDRKLEALRAEINQRDSVRATATAALTAAHLAGHERTLRALETIWAETVRLRDGTPMYAAMAEILLKEEFVDAFANNDKYRELIEEVDEAEEAKAFFGSGSIELERAFAGEYVYSLFFAYRAYSGRVPTLMLRSLKKTGRVECWHEDAALDRIVSAVLTPEELATVRAARVMKLRTVQQLIERRMLEHIARVLSGEASGMTNLEQAYRILEAASRAEERANSA